MKLARGFEFTHLHHLDPDWKPGLGQKYKDAPKARMRVSRVTSYAVYFTYLDGRGKCVMDRSEFERQYLPADSQKGK